MHEMKFKSMPLQVQVKSKCGTGVIIWTIIIKTEHFETM